MSSSTVAVSANPALNTPLISLGPNSRRRTNVSVTEKRTAANNVEMAFDEQMSSDGNRIRSDATAATTANAAADLSKKHVITSTAGVPPRPRRKVVKTVSEKPRFQKVASVLFKNIVLVVVLLGLVQLITRLLSSGYKDVALVREGGFSEIEERIGEIDSLVKKTAKMVQVQFEVVDKKIENEIGGARRDLTKKLDEKSAILEKGLKDLEGRMDGLENSLSEFESYKFLTKDDLETFSEELKNSRGREGSDEVVSLDEIRATARDIVIKEIEKHAADGIGRVDYALASGGAFIVEHSEPLMQTGAGSWIRSRRMNDHPNKMLQPSFGEPGNCFPLKGSNGFVEVRLRTEIIPDAITLEHVAKSVAFDRSSAPKDCRISGWLQSQVADQPSQVVKFLLAEFTYDLERSNAQTFDVDSTYAGLINTVRFEFTSNYGATHTCIYRLRVHGHEPDSVAVSTLQH